MSEEYEEIPPDAESLIESTRGIGYTLPTALADIIDNSIAAGSRNVWLKFKWCGTESSISVRDDGSGMTEKQLSQAMRLGSQNPLIPRSKEDLGRFGLGLKTAAFSQARRLTVSSRKSKKGKKPVRRWDLDYLARPEVTGWRLLLAAHEDTDQELYDTQGKGTVVLLERLDRVISDDSEEQKNHFQSEIVKARKHLEMVFHRYLEGRRPKLKIHQERDDGDPDDVLNPWDPFCSDTDKYPATQWLEDDRARDDLAKFDVRFKGFILPHKDKFGGHELHTAAAGPDGWNKHQGFYVYRNKRLIIAGGWLGLGRGADGWKQEDHYKLARIQLDIPNKTDHEWQIDVKKSTAKVPSVLRPWMTNLAASVREKAKQVYGSRGTPRQTNAGDRNTDPLWNPKTVRNKLTYRIDRKHPVIKAFLKLLPKDLKQPINSLLNMIQESVPVHQIWMDAAEKQEDVGGPYQCENQDALKKDIIETHRAFVASGNSPSEAWEKTAACPPFQNDTGRAIIESLKENDNE